jgi:hypothetical protein
MRMNKLNSYNAGSTNEVCQGFRMQYKKGGGLILAFPKNLDILALLLLTLLSSSLPDLRWHEFLKSRCWYRWSVRLAVA